MRLTKEQLEAIKTAFSDYLPGSEVFLYGSRTNDSKKGGDIDLLVNVDRKPDRLVKAKIINSIYKKIGEQKIDILYNLPNNDSAFVNLIKLEAKPI